jgi:hypothetical protein
MVRDIVDLLKGYLPNPDQLEGTAKASVVVAKRLVAKVKVEFGLNEDAA